MTVICGPVADVLHRKQRIHKIKAVLCCSPKSQDMFVLSISEDLNSNQILEIELTATQFGQLVSCGGTTAEALYRLDPSIGERMEAQYHTLYVTDLKRPRKEIDAQLLQLKSEGWEIAPGEKDNIEPDYAFPDGNGGGHFRLVLYRWVSPIEDIQGSDETDTGVEEGWQEDLDE